MKKLFLIFIVSYAFGWDKFYPAFHANVVNVAKGDVLNIRSKPTYKSKKLGYFEPGQELQVGYCLDSPKSTWCKVYPAVNIDIARYPNQTVGWVNARYLEFKNQGYVNIKNRKSDCDYLLKCKGSKCLILSDKLEWIEREHIGLEKGQKATSSPQDPEANGVVDGPTFCFNHYRDTELWSKAKRYIK